MRLLSLSPRALFVAAIAALAACGGDTPTENDNPSITLAVSGQALTLVQGASATLTATVVRTDFDGAVALSAEGAPSGLTVSFSPASLSGSVNASTITFAAGASLASGTHTVTIRAAGSGVTAQTKTVAVTVSASGGFSLSVAPASVTMTQGASAAATVNITRSGSFTSAVNLTVSGAPAGMTVTVTPASATAATASLAISTTASTAVGTHTLTVRGNATGMSEQTVTLSAVVTAASAGTQITLPFCADDIPVWFAYQNDGGAWTRVTPSASNTVTFTLATSKGGVALVTGSDVDGYDTEVFYATAAEFQTLAQAVSAEGCDPTSAGKTLNGSVAGITATQFADVVMHDGYASVYGANPPLTFSLGGVGDGPRDLIAGRFDMSETDYIPNRVIVRRALNLANGATIPVLDFAAAEAVAPATATLTVTGAASTDEVGAFVTFSTANGTYANLGFPAMSATNTATAYGVPTSKLIAGDMHSVFAFASNAAQTSSRSASMYHQQLAARTLALGPELATPTVTTLSATTPVRLRAVTAVQSEYGGAMSAEFTQPASGAAWRNVYVQMSAGYRGSATTWDLAIPDFGTASGFNAAWGLQAGAQYDWSVYAHNTSLTAEWTPTEGLSVKAAYRTSASMATPSVQASAAGREPVRHLRPRKVMGRDIR